MQFPIEFAGVWSSQMKALYTFYFKHYEFYSQGYPMYFSSDCTKEKVSLLVSISAGLGT